MNTNLPVFTEALDEIEFSEWERPERQVAEVATLLYDWGISLRRVTQVLGWLGVERFYGTVWKWI